MFTVEGTQGNGAIPFLDTLVTPLADRSLSIKVYCKPTHTNQYLQWDSHHSLSAKYSVIGTLTHRAKVVYTDPELLQNHNQTWKQGHNRTSCHSLHKRNCGNIKQICGKYGIQVHFKDNTTIKQVLMKPKDQGPKEMKSGIMYSYQCSHLACDEEYIGDTARTLRERRKEQLKQPSPIHGHIQCTNHAITDNSFNIIGREDWGQVRTIKELILIRVNNLTLNQNIGNYNLSHIWDRVLFNTPRLKLGLFPIGYCTHIGMVSISLALIT